MVASTCITLMGLLVATAITNRRIGRTLNHVDDVRDVLRAEMRADSAEKNARFTSLEAKMDTHHEVVLRMLADVENRIR